MSESFPVASVIEQSVNNQVNALVGNKDTNLNTIVKMSLMNELQPLPHADIIEVINKIRTNNELEHYYIQNEYGLTMDCAGNLISIANIDEGDQSKTDTEGVLPTSEGSK